MTRLLPPLLVVLLFALPPCTSAADEPLLQDPAGDVFIYPVNGQDGSAVPAGRMAAQDLLAASVVEERDRFIFTLHVAALSDGLALVESADLSLTFAYGERMYWINYDILYRVDDPGPAMRASLRVFDNEKGYSFIRDLPIEFDVAAATVSAIVERNDILDENGAKPYVGSALRGFVAGSSGFFAGPRISTGGQQVGMPMQTSDRMPDDGFGPAWQVRLGLAQSGDARLSSEVPARASNGEATTFVFQVVASNLGSDEDLFRLDAVGAPSAWTVTLPQTLLRLDGGESQVIPVLVATPFRHQHGSRDAFVLEMQSTSDANSVGRVELSVLYVETPQPAGHHDTLFLHGRAWDAELAPVFDAALAGFQDNNWMNTRSDDPFDDAAPRPGRMESFGFPDGSSRASHAWDFPLSPQLQVGLDFDLARTGLLSATIETTTPAPAASLAGELIYLGPAGSGEEGFDGERGRSETVLAHIEPAPVEDLDANGARDYQLEITPTPESDLVAFQPDTGLVLRLAFTHERPTTPSGLEAPRILPGASLVLPLNEYHDPVDDVFATMADVALVPVGAQERLVNPGKTVVFDVALRNGDASAHTFKLGLAGSGVEWARLLGPATVKVPAGGEAMLRVAVSPSADAHHGDFADLILEAGAADDEALRSLVRLYALVDSTQELADEGALMADDEAKQSPGASAVTLLVLLALLAGLAGARRRV